MQVAPPSPTHFFFVRHNHGPWRIAEAKDERRAVCLFAFRKLRGQEAVRLKVGDCLDCVPMFGRDVLGHAAQELNRFVYAAG